MKTKRATRHRFVKAQSFRVRIAVLKNSAASNLHLP
jgi:hypothetical protein